jgi:hypothetical protein
MIPVRLSRLCALIPAVPLLGLGGCTTDTPRAKEVELSTKYDRIDCATLAAERDALAARYPYLPPERTEAAIAWGGFTVIGDALDRIDHEERVAKGRIDAMSDSLRRRNCG